MSDLYLICLHGRQDGLEPYGPLRPTYVPFGMTYRDKLGFVIGRKGDTTLPVRGMSQPRRCRSVLGERPPGHLGAQTFIDNKTGQNGHLRQTWADGYKDGQKTANPHLCLRTYQIRQTGHFRQDGTKDDKDGKIGNVRIVGKSRKSLDCRETSGLVRKVRFTLFCPVRRLSVIVA